jgi:hypothetical protein
LLSINPDEIVIAKPITLYQRYPMSITLNIFKKWSVIIKTSAIIAEIKMDVALVDLRKKAAINIPKIVP